MDRARLNSPGCECNERRDLDRALPSKPVCGPPSANDAEKATGAKGRDDGT